MSGDAKYSQENISGYSKKTQAINLVQQLHKAAGVTKHAFAEEEGSSLCRCGMKRKRKARHNCLGKKRGKARN